MKNNTQETQNNHIQLPKFILKNFSSREKIINDKGLPEKHDFVYCMSMNGNISKIDIKDANVQENYFNSETETRLFKIESTLGDIINKIKLVNKDINNDFFDFEFEHDEIKNIKKYCTLCLIRSEEFVKQIVKRSDCISLVGEEPQNIAVNTWLKKGNLSIDKFIEKKNITIAVSTTTNFILPQIGNYFFDYPNSIWDIYMPVTPNISIVFTDQKIIGEDGSRLTRILDDEYVDNLNKSAIKREATYNMRAIYAKSDQDLLKYKNFLLSFSNK